MRRRLEGRVVGLDGDPRGTAAARETGGGAL